MKTNHSEDDRLLDIIQGLAVRFKLEGKEVEFSCSSLMADKRKGKRIIREMEERGLVIIERDLPRSPHPNKLRVTPVAYDGIKEEWPDLCAKFDDISKQSPPASNKGIRIELLSNANLKWIIEHADDYTIESWDMRTELSACTTLIIGKESDAWHPMSDIYVRDYALSEKIRQKTRRDRIDKFFKANLGWAIVNFAHVSEEDAKHWYIGEGWLNGNGYKVHTTLNESIQNWNEDAATIVTAARTAAREAHEQAVRIERVNAAITAIGGWKVLGEKLMAHAAKYVDAMPLDEHLK